MAAKTETTAGSGVVSVLVSGSSHSSKFLSHDRSLLARVCACHRRGDLLQGRLDEVQPGGWECVPKQVMLHVRLMCKCMVLPSLACAVLLLRTRGIWRPCGGGTGVRLGFALALSARNGNLLRSFLQVEVVRQGFLLFCLSLDSPS